MNSPIRILALLCLTLAGTSGCLSARSVVWQGPAIPASIGVTEGEAEESLASAAFAERTGQAESTDWYYDTALIAWAQMSADHEAGLPPCSRLQSVYRIAVTRWLETACHSGRWIPGVGIQVHTPEGATTCVPICPAGFAWQADEFEELHPIGEYCSPSLSQYHQRDGLGCPLVVRKCSRTLLRPGDRFLPPHISFSATAILRPGDGPEDPPAVLEL